MTLTTNDLRNHLLNWDVEEICSVLDIGPEEILDRFEDLISARYDYICGQLELFEEPEEEDEEELNLDKEEDDLQP